MLTRPISSEKEYLRYMGIPTAGIPVRLPEATW